MIPVRRYRNLLSAFLRPLRGKVVLLSVVLLGSIALQLVNPQILRFFIDTAVEGGSQSELVRAAVLFMVFAVFHQGLAVVATYLAEHVGWTVTNQMRRDLAAHVLDLDMGFHKEHAPGELIERVDGDVTSLSNFFSQFTIQVLGNAVLLVGILVLLTVENWLIGLGLSIFAGVALFGMARVQSFAVPLWARVRGRNASFFGFLGEQLGATEDLRANGADEFVMQRFTVHHRDWLPDEVRARLGWAVLWSTTIVLFAGATAYVFGLGSFLFTEGTLTIGSVYLVFHYTEMMRQPIERIRTQMEDLQKAGAGIDRVEALFATTSRLERSGEQSLPSGPLAVDFERVSFAYQDGDGNGRTKALHELSFLLPPGRVLGVLGRSGSGKTTLARLLTRLYDPDEGTIELAGLLLPTVETTDLRRHVGLVTQDVHLFRATVRDNLTLFDRSVSDERINAVLGELGLDAWVGSLPHGLDTRLGSNGGLSAGEAQLLAFTRIFLENPGLVVLDEASSRVDPATEQLIERAVDRLLAERTGVIIAHRLATVERADDILILDGGQLVEFGRRRDLVADPDSRFSRLLQTGMEEVLA